MGAHLNLNKLSAAGVLIAFGIIYGDIGTSPLYVFNAITKNQTISEALIIGALSCVLWTITLQTTIKYVWQVLKADNNGEGGTFALYALVRRRRKWLVIPAMIGGASLLADGIITPPISITSAIEGIRKLEAFHAISQSTIVAVVLVIISLFFFMQKFGTATIGKFFGPLMFIWFTMLAVLGVANLGAFPAIFKALNPYYAINFLSTYHFILDGHTYSAFWLLGAIFLCTTGAEALYSDLGHAGRPNIRVSWIYVKLTLVLNYLGQGAYLLAHHNNKTFTEAYLEQNHINAFYDLMPTWFVVPGVIIATLAAIIASQAMISGSYTLISEATRLNLWPKMKINFPSDAKGQLYIPGMNLFMYIGCVFVVLYFQTSSKMEAAYGLAIIITMLMSTILYANYMVIKRVNKSIIYLFLFVYLIIETAFLLANVPKFPEGGYATFVVAGLMFSIMYAWFRARKIKNRYVEFERLDTYMPMLQELSNDTSIPKYATHLVYLTSANNSHEIEKKIMFSILNKKPKRADIYWFIHVDVLDEPYRTDYVVNTIIPNEIIRIEFRLGFREEQRINLMFRKVVEDMVKNKEVNITSRYESLSKNKVAGDWQFIVMEKYLSHENDLPLSERIIMNMYFWLKKFSLSEEKGFGLDSSYVVVEKYPLVVSPVQELNLNRVD